MAIGYEATEWKDGAQGGTPIDAAALNKMENGISEACAAVDLLNEEGNVTTEDIASKAVTTEKIADGAVGLDQLSEEVRDSVSQYSQNGWQVLTIGASVFQSSIIDMPMPAGSQANDVTSTIMPPVAIPNATALATVVGGIGRGGFMSMYDVNVRAEVDGDGALTIVLMRSQDSFLSNSAQYRISVLVIGMT